MFHRKRRVCASGTADGGLLNAQVSCSYVGHAARRLEFQLKRDLPEPKRNTGASKLGILELVEGHLQKLHLARVERYNRSGH